MSTIESLVSNLKGSSTYLISNYSKIVQMTYTLEFLAKIITLPMS